MYIDKYVPRTSGAQYLTPEHQPTLNRRRFKKLAKTNDHHGGYS